METGLSPGIKLFFQLGNLFIMDSETLVANPFYEMQQDVIGEVTKKNSSTERLTSIKNKVCEKHYIMAKTRIEIQRARRLKQLLDNSSKLRHEVKVMELDRQRHKIELLKRLQPDHDYSYDDIHIVNKEKRLAGKIIPCYLDNTLQYPTRQRSASDTSLTPTVCKARASLRLHHLQKATEKGRPAASLSPAHTTKPTATPLAAVRTDSRQHGSRSTPVSAVSGTDKSRRFPPRTFSTTPRLHATDKDKPANKSWQHQMKTPEPSEERTGLLCKSYTYYSEAGRNRDDLAGGDDDDNDVDHTNKPEIIDLRAHFLKDDTMNNPRISAARGPRLPHTDNHLLTGRKFRLSRNMMMTEAENINSRVQKFIKDLEVTRGQESVTDPGDIIHSTPDHPHTLHRNAEGRTGQSSKTGDKVNSVLTPALTKSPTMPEIKHHAAGSASQQASRDAKRPKDDDNAKESGDVQVPPRKISNSWKFIKGRSADGHLRGTYSPEDLVLQAMTGIPIRNVLRTPVPLHSASRAMRHTATFRMFKVVERLISDRTRYQKYMVEELKQQITEELVSKTKTEGETKTSGSGELAGPVPAILETS